MIRNALLFSICFLFLLSACAPKNLSNEGTKNEFERPIAKEEFPAQALQLIEQVIPEETDIKYYQESDGSSISYEAKLNYENQEYSIEFNSTGDLEDIEIVADFETLDIDIQEILGTYLSEQYTSYSITRLQIQYSDTESNSEALLTKVLSKNMVDLRINYELEIEGKNDKELGFFEFLFDSDGQMIQKRRIFKRSFDNVW